LVNIFIIGSKGIPAKYGGFETFVENLTRYRKSLAIKYHISCLADNNEEFEYNNSRCFNIKVPKVGSAKAVLYDVMSLKETVRYIEENNINNSIVYILACRIGPFFSFYKRKIEKLGAKVYVNPDGHEWKRSKWNWAIKKYWKLSEKLMVKDADILVCDSRGIEDYIHDEYRNYNPKTSFISYGATVENSTLDDHSKKLIGWFQTKGIRSNEFYLIVGRFVPENNYELMIKEFMMSNTKKDLVIITNVEQNKFYEDLKRETEFTKDNRIKFVGTVYDQELLKKIREKAYAYIHGHEVGGTNPSLLEALASTNINLLLNVVFNNEVGEDVALYFSKEKGSLSNLIDQIEKLDEKSILHLGQKAKNRIKSNYSWDKIINDYENLFLEI